MLSLKIFISYPHTNDEMAEQLAARLKAEGHDVFWDRASLPSGESFDDRIRDSIENSDLLVCLVSKDSLSEGKYARTELGFAQQKWPNPSGRILPVALDDEAIKSVPAYLKSVTFKNPEGDVVAEVLDEVRRIARRPVRRLWLGARILIILAVLSAVGWLAIQGLPGNPVKLAVGMSGTFYENTGEGSTQVLSATTDYTQLLERGLNGDEHVDGEQLLQLIDLDETMPEDNSPLPVLGFLISNNSNDTIVVDRLRLSVRESRIDKKPLLWSSSTYRHSNGVINASFQLGNDGWGAASDIRYVFDIVGENALVDKRSDSERRFSKVIATVDSGDSQTVEFWNEISAFVSDLSFLQVGPHPYDNQIAMSRFANDVAALKAKIGAAPDEPVNTIGELHYTWGDNAEARLSYRQQLQIVYPGPTASPVMLSTAKYQIELKPEGKNYNIERNIGHEIKPGETEAIDLHV